MSSDAKKTSPESTDKDEGKIPGNQERPMTKEEELDEAVEETFPASDPVAPSRIDGPIKPD